MIKKVNPNETSKSVKAFFKDDYPILLARAGASHDFLDSDEQRDGLLGSIKLAYSQCLDVHRKIISMKAKKAADYVIAREIGYEIAQTRRLRVKAYIEFAERLAALSDVDLRVW